MPTVLATTSTFGQWQSRATALLRAAGHNLQTNPHGRRLTEDELAELLRQHRPVGLLAGTEPVTNAVLEAARGHLKVISRVGVGWDNVDREAAARLGIPVLRTEGVLSDAVAELTLGMILGALRHIPRHDRELRAGAWVKRPGGLLRGRTLGIVGFGAIGRCVAKLAAAFEPRIIYADARQISSPLGTQRALPALLAEADIVTLHASGSGRLLGPAELDLMKPGAVLVNTARGGMVDEDALAERLASEAIGCACLDVFEAEPYEGPLRQAPNAVLTPHIGSYAAEVRADMEFLAVKNLLAVLDEV